MAVSRTYLRRQSEAAGKTIAPFRYTPNDPLFLTARRRQGLRVPILPVQRETSYQQL